MPVENPAAPLTEPWETNVRAVPVVDIAVLHLGENHVDVGDCAPGEQEQR